MKKKLLIVEPGIQVYKEAIVKSIYETGLVELYFATGLQPINLSKWVDPYSESLIEFSYHVVENSLLKQIRFFQDTKGIIFDGVMTYIETSVHFTNKLQHDLGLPVISLFTGKEIRSKSKMRQLFLNNGVTQPKFHIINNNLNITEFSKLNMNFPLIVKPTEMMGSLAVRKVNNFNELLIAIQHAKLLISKMKI